MSNKNKIPQVTFITLEQYKLVADDANSTLDKEDREEDPFKLEDYVNMVIFGLAEEGCTDIEVSEFNKTLATAPPKNSTKPMEITPYVTETYLFMIKFKTEVDIPDKRKKDDDEDTD